MVHTVKKKKNEFDRLCLGLILLDHTLNVFVKEQAVYGTSRQLFHNRIEASSYKYQFT